MSFRFDQANKKNLSYIILFLQTWQPALERFLIIFRVTIPQLYAFVKLLINCLFQFGSLEAKKYCIRLYFVLEHFFFV